MYCNWSCKCITPKDTPFPTEISCGFLPNSLEPFLRRIPKNRLFPHLARVSPVSKYTGLGGRSRFPPSHVRKNRTYRFTPRVPVLLPHVEFSIVFYLSPRQSFLLHLKWGKLLNFLYCYLHLLVLLLCNWFHPNWCLWTVNFVHQVL